jgi:hypothetical protein
MGLVLGDGRGLSGSVVDLDRAWVALGCGGDLRSGQASQDRQRQDDQGQRFRRLILPLAMRPHPLSLLWLVADQRQSRLTCVACRTRRSAARPCRCQLPLARLSGFRAELHACFPAAPMRSAPGGPVAAAREPGAGLPPRLGQQPCRPGQRPHRYPDGGGRRVRDRPWRRRGRHRAGPPTSSCRPTSASARRPRRPRCGSGCGPSGTAAPTSSR